MSHVTLSIERGIDMSALAFLISLVALCVSLFAAGIVRGIDVKIKARMDRAQSGTFQGAQKAVSEGPSGHAFQGHGHHPRPKGAA